MSSRVWASRAADSADQRATTFSWTLRGTLSTPNMVTGTPRVTIIDLVRECSSPIQPFGSSSQVRRVLSAVRAEADTIQPSPFWASAPRFGRVFMALSATTTIRGQSKLVLNSANTLGRVEVSGTLPSNSRYDTGIPSAVEEQAELDDRVGPVLLRMTPLPGRRTPGGGLAQRVVVGVSRCGRSSSSRHNRPFPATLSARPSPVEAACCRASARSAIWSNAW